jgi:hypothetical protein
VFVDAFEDNRIGFEVHVEDAVYETEVEACCEDDELEEEHAKWSGESHCCHLFPAFVLEIKRSENVGILRGFAKSGCTFGQENGAVGFGKPEERDPRDAGEDEPNPENPPPIERGGNKARYQRCCEWSNARSLDEIRLDSYWSWN